MTNISYREKYLYNKRTVLVEMRVYERLKARGRFGETYSQIIERLLDELEVEKNKK